MLFWDILFSLFVLFPIFTGGLWYRGEKIFLEYTEPGAAAFILALVLYYLLHIQKRRLEESFLLRSGKKIWDYWSEKVYSQKYYALTGVYFLVSLLWFCASVRRHMAFSSGAADLGIFTNTLWNLTHGNGYICSVKDGIHLLVDHQSYFFYLFYPFFKIVPSPLTLLALQSLGLASTGIALLLLAKQILPSRHKLLPLLPLLFWAYQPIRSANLFDFHPEVFMLPLFLFSLFFLQTEKILTRSVGILFFLLALSTKESAAAVGVGVCIAFFLGASPAPSRFFTRYFSLFGFTMSAALFYIDVKIVPQHFGANYTYSNVYGTLGPDIHQLILSPFRMPLEFLQHLIGPMRVKFFFGLMAPFLFFPLRSWRAFIAALPGFLMLFLADNNQRVSLGFHYAIEPAVGILWAFVLALKTEKLILHQRKLLWALGASALIFFGRSEMFQIRHFHATPYEKWLQGEVLPKIHPSASIAAPSALVPHLSTREWIHFLPVIKKVDGNLVDCLIIEPNVNNTPLNQSDFYQLQQVVEKNFELEFSCYNAKFHLYKNKLNAASCVTTAIQCPSKDVAATAKWP